MEAIVLVALLGALGLLTNRRGHDRRARRRSDEETLAAPSHAWDEIARPTPAAPRQRDRLPGGVRGGEGAPSFWTA